MKNNHNKLIQKYISEMTADIERVSQSKFKATVYQQITTKIKERYQRMVKSMLQQYTSVIDSVKNGDELLI